MSKQNGVIWYKPKGVTGRESKHWKLAAIILDGESAQWSLMRFRKANPGVKFRLRDEPPGPVKIEEEKNIRTDL